MANKEVIETVIQFNIDRASVQSTQAAITDIRSRFVNDLGSGAEQANIELAQLRGELIGAAKDASTLTTEGTNDVMSASGKLVGAGREVSGALNEVVPGLGRMTSALLSLDPISIAVAGSIALATAAFKHLKDDADAARKAAEEASAADVKATESKTKLEQLTTLAMSGNEAARNKIIEGLGDAYAQQKVTLEGVKKATEDANKAQADYDKALAAVNSGGIKLPGQYFGEIDTANKAKAALEGYQKTLDDTRKTHDDAERTLGNYNNAANKLGLSEKELAAARLGDSQSVEGTIAALQESKKQADAFTKGLTDGAANLAKGVQTVKDAIQKHLEELAKVEADWQAKRLQYVEDTTKKYNEDVAKLESDANSKRADLAKQYNDKLIELASAAKDAAASALQHLEEAQVNAKTQLDRGILDQQIKDQRAEVKALTDHERKLRDIRQQASDQEADLIANRDFAGLFRLRRDTGKKLNAENEAFQNAATDRQTQQNAERADRMRAYQQQLADAQTQYNKQLQQISANLDKQRQVAGQKRDQDLKALNDKLTQELALKRTAYIAELQLLAMSHQARIKLEADQQNALLKQAAQYYGALRTLAPGMAGTGGGAAGAKMTTRALGGALAAGQSSLVNEAGGGESFSAGGQSMLFPGMGVFTPLKSGNVNTGGKTVTYAPTYNITSGNSPTQNAALVKLIEDRTYKAIEDLLT